MRERITGLGNVDDTNWHTQTTQLCTALTVFQHAETAAHSGGIVCCDERAGGPAP
jgi:hypothetical protein